MPQASFRLALLSLACLVATGTAVQAEGLNHNLDQPDIPPTCLTQTPGFDKTIYQAPIDATQHFTMQVYLMNAATPDNPNLTLLYYATQGSNHYFNPTLVVPQGGTIDFTLQNCLNADGRSYIAGLLSQGLAAPPSFTPGAFNVIQAPQPMPSAYINIHTHGLGGAPKPSTAAQPDVDAGDEVLLTFLAPNIVPATPPSYPTTADYQHYKILVPSTDVCSPHKPGTQNCQDPGTYWYHPHLHGEAQPQVFLGLTGAIVVVAKGQSVSSFDPSGLFVVRDYPSSAPAPPPPPPAMPATASDKSAIISMSSGQVQVIHTRDLIYQASAKSPATSGAAVSHNKARSASPDALAQGIENQPVSPVDIPRCKLLLVAPQTDPALPDPCLPDQVTSAQTSTTPPSLTTLITVNGAVTETYHLDSSGSRPIQELFFTPGTTTVKGTIRVLNSSANTYLRIALHNGTTVYRTVPPFPPYSAKPDPALGNAVPLRVTNRDGHPVGPTTPDVENATSILLAPGSRVEFSPASPPAADLNLVSEPVDTGPAGDLVPFRTLAILHFPAPTPALSHASELTRKIDNGDSQRYQSVTRDIAAPGTASTPPQGAHPAKINKRAFAFYEQSRTCAPNVTDCGQSFYLIDITNSVYGDPNDNLKRSAVTTASPFAMPMHADGSPTRDLFGLNGQTLAPSIPSVQVALHSSTEEVDEDWDIYNFTAENHAFHVHQLGFYILDSCSAVYLNGKKLAPDCSKAKPHQGDENKESGLLLDVINVPPAYDFGVPASLDPTGYILYPSKVSIRVPFNQSIVGNFVLHCHLLEHEDNGMMMGIQVWPGEIPDPATPSPASTNAAPETSHTSSATTSMPGMAMK